MLEIKTIINTEAKDFDADVNIALEDGWELVRRDVLPPYEGMTGIWSRVFYAELERIVDELEEELEEDDGTAEWKLSRDPMYPFRCTACGCKSQDALRTCPHCKRIMVMPE